MRISYSRLIDAPGNKLRLVLYIQDEADLAEVKRAKALLEERTEVESVRSSSISVPLAEAKAFVVTLDFGAPIQTADLVNFFTFLDRLPVLARPQLTA